MEKNYLSVSDGTYTLQEGENKNQFYFYRNDGEPLTDDIGIKPIDLYHAYIIKKMMDGEIKDLVMNNIYSEISDDKKVIRLTTCDIGEKTESGNDSVARTKEPSFFKRLLNKIFG